MAEPVEDLERRINAINGELTRRITEVQQQRKRTNLITGLLVVFFLGYLLWTTFYISRHLTPANIIASVYGQATRQLPSAIEEAAHALQASAPALVSEMLRGVAVSIPQARKSAQKRVDVLLQDAFVQIESHLETAMPIVFPEHPDGVARLMRPMGEHEIKAMARELANALEVTIEAEGEGLDDDALKQIRDKIWAIQEELDTLRRGGTKLTDMQRLEKRFIELVIQLSHREAS